MWKHYILFFLHKRLLHLESRIRKLEEEGVDLTGNFHVKLYVSVVSAMKLVRQDPTLDAYVQGNTLGKTHRDWRRIKQLLPDRYRLFFKFFSSDKSIFFAWLNDENTMRKKGATTDCYTVFSGMLGSGTVPSDREGLEKKSVSTQSAIQKNE